tara:strand:+ start:716 stop:1885 length:1170 start_codon:yes stop_codon:yes gene_type:complete
MSQVKRLNLTDFGKVKPREIFIPKITKKYTDDKSKNKIKEDIIEVDFDEKIDIKMIHNHIMETFKELQKQLDEKELRLSFSSNTEGMTKEEKIIMEMDSMQILEDIELLEKKISDFNNYIEESTEMIDIYEKYVPEILNDKFIEETLGLIAKEFINLAMKFTNKIRITTQYGNVKRCHCGDIFVLAGNKYICFTCDAEISIKTESNSSNETKYDYYRSDNFEEYIDEYQGLRKNCISPEVYEIIFNHCDVHNIDPKTLKKADLLRILKKYKMPEYYKSINLISNVICETPLPDIQEYRQRLMERHRLIEEEYFHEREEAKRNNFMSAWFVLKAFLIMENYHFEKDDYLQMAEDALNWHNKFMAKLCKNILKRQSENKSIKGNWEFSPIH